MGSGDSSSPITSPTATSPPTPSPTSPPTPSPTSAASVPQVTSYSVRCGRKNACDEENDDYPIDALMKVRCCAETKLNDDFRKKKNCAIWATSKILGSCPRAKIMLPPFKRAVVFPLDFALRRNWSKIAPHGQVAGRMSLSFGLLPQELVNLFPNLNFMNIRMM